MSENEKKDILGAELDEEQLDKTAGGAHPLVEVFWDSCGETQHEDCMRNHYHNRLAAGCAATVESGSNCWSSDACSYQAVHYGTCKNVLRGNTDHTEEESS